MLASTMLILFKNKLRDFTGPAGNGESYYKYYDRSSRPDIQRVREQIEAMLSNYPVSHRDELVGRLKTTNNDQYSSAMFELILHEMLIKTGHTVLELEPIISSSDKRPDFLVKAPDGEVFLLEALSYSEHSHDNITSEHIKNEFRNHINNVVSPYYLDVKVKGSPTQFPSKNKLLRKLETWVGVLTDSSLSPPKPKFTWSEGGLSVEATPMAKKSSMNANARTIGLEFGKATRVPQDGNLSGSLKSKMSRYGKPDLPLCIAITSNQIFTGKREVISTLFGTEAMAFNRNDFENTARWIRNNDGLWRAKEPQYKRCSAVLYFKSLSECSMSRKKGIIIHNPDATHPLSGKDIPVQHYKLNNENLAPTNDEVRLGECLNLDPSWPE